MSNSALFSAGSATFAPSSTEPSETQRHFTKRVSVSGLNITLGANESIEFEFNSNHTDTFRTLLSGDTSIQLKNPFRTDATIRVIPTSGTTREYDIAQYYSHGAMSILKIIAGADPQDISLEVNGNAIASQNIGASVNITNIGSGTEWIKRLTYYNSSDVATLEYDFLETSGTTASPSTGSGDLTFASEPARFEFILSDGIWEADLPDFPDDARIRIPVDATEIRNAPIPSNITLALWSAYGQSLGEWFLNGSTNYQRNYGTVLRGYQASDVSPSGLHRYSPRQDKQSAGHILLDELTTGNTNSFAYYNGAQTSQDIATLSEGDESGYFEALINDATIVNANATIEAAVLSHVQGERDQTIGTTGEVYKTLLGGLNNSYITRMRALTGNNNLPVKFLFTQVGNNQSGTREIKQAQYEFARENNDNPNIIFVRPNHSLNLNFNDKLDTPSADPTHLSPLGYTQIEEFFARAYSDENWQPIITQSATCDITGGSQTIVVTCLVQTAPLRAKVAASDNLGVWYVQPNDTVVTPSSVTLSNNTITIEVGQTVESGGKIRFGEGGELSGGEIVNIIDSTEWTGGDSGITHSHQMAMHDIEITDSTPVVSPVANAGPDRNVAAGGTVSVGGADTVGTNPIASISWSVPTGKGSVSPSNTAEVDYTGHSPSSQEVITLTKTVTDNQGNTDDDEVFVTVAAAIINNPPSVSISGPASIEIGSTGEFTATISDDDIGDTHTIVWSASAGTIDNPNALTITLTPPATPQSITLTAVANDGDDPSPQQSVSVQIVEPADTTPPTYTLTPSQLIYTIAVGSSFAVPVLTLNDNVDNPRQVPPTSNNVDTDTPSSTPYEVRWEGLADAAGNAIPDVVVQVNVVNIENPGVAFNRTHYEIELGKQRNIGIRSIFTDSDNKLSFRFNDGYFDLSKFTNIIFRAYDLDDQSTIVIDKNMTNGISLKGDVLEVLIFASELSVSGRYYIELSNEGANSMHLFSGYLNLIKTFN
ncbi:hypothetical protein [Glaciecola sp. 1036]|uniref:hypothetical protein n=1 Tax=Alteromonadaceae TaxID=72275 RepID=UPI003D05DC9C